MLQSQKLELRRSEVRERLNEVNSQDTVEKDGLKEINELTKELGALEVRYRAALVTEDNTGQAPTPTEEHLDTQPDGAAREYSRLVERLELRSYIGPILKDQSPEGAEAEVQQQWNMAANQVPWEAIAPHRRSPLEIRAAVTPAPSTVAAVQQAILARVFAMSSGEYLGVDSPMVPVGTALYPVLVTGTTVSMQSKDAQQDSTAGSFTPFNISPTRLTGKFTWRVEDSAVLAGMEEALRADLSMALSDVRDKQILQGNGTAPNVSGFLDELPAATAVAAETGFGVYAEKATEGLDGIYASEFTEMRHLVHPAIGAHMAAAFISAGGSRTDSVSAWQYVRSISGGLKASANLKEPPANKRADAITFRAGRGAGSAVSPMWQGITFIRDEITDADAGQVHLTALALWGFKVVRESAYRLWQAQHA